MKNTAQKVVVVTGTSSGIGKLTARELAAQGRVVYATMRDPQGKNRTAHDELLGLAEAEGYELHVQDIDVIETVATVRLELDNWTGNRFTDLFTLLKIDGEWKIMNKVFHAHA